MGLIIDLITKAEKKGELLELLVEDIFRDDAFNSVSRQKGGSQYGFDVIAYRGKECWKIECKNLKDGSKVTDIAPKLIWHSSNKGIDRFVIVSPFGISNELRHLLEKKLFYFPVEIWSGDFLEKKICQSSSAKARLGISNFNANASSGPEVFPQNEIFFDVYHVHVLPYSYDYFFRSEGLVKAYSEKDFIINATIHNPTNADLVITEVNAKTIAHEKINSRILRQFKFKGLVEPIKLEFAPKNYSGGQISLLSDGKLIEVRAGDTIHISFHLSEETNPGFYQLMFEVNARLNGQVITMFSPIFCLNKIDGQSDVVALCVVGKYYDSPVPRILNLNQNEWTLLRDHDHTDVKFLGQTNLGIIQGKTYDSWKVMEMEGHEILDLGIPIEEKLYSAEDSLQKIFGTMNPNE